MVNRVTLYAAALVSSLSFSGIAFAADAPKASVSGPANGTIIEPSAAVQRQAVETQMEGRKVFYKPKVLPFGMRGAALAAGAPGVEGAPGTESGR
jgi:hypothetical protein